MKLGLNSAAMLMRGARFLMPRHYGDWAEAMAAEFQCREHGRNLFSFALGCFAAAVRLRAQATYRSVPDLALLGSIIGFFLVVHAAIPDTHAWPLLWPCLGGVFAVLLRKEQDTIGFWSPIAAGARAGALAALVFAVGTTILIWWSGKTNIEARWSVILLGSVLSLLASSCAAAIASLCLKART